MKFKGLKLHIMLLIQNLIATSLLALKDYLIAQGDPTMVSKEVCDIF